MSKNVQFHGRMLLLLSLFSNKDCLPISPFYLCEFESSTGMGLF